MKPLQLSWRCHLAIAVASCTTVVVAGAYACFYLGAQRRQGHYRQHMLTQLVTPLVQQVRHGTQTDQEAFETWARVMGAHPDIARVALIDKHDMVELSYPPIPDNNAWYYASERLAPFEVLRLPVQLPVRTTLVTEIVIVVRPGSSLLNTPFKPAPLWPAALAGLLMVLPASCWLRRKSEAPWRVFVQRAQATLGAFAPALPDGQLNAECAKLLDNIDALRRDAIAWYEEANRLNGLIDSKVQAKTKQISVLLKRAQRKAGTDPLTGIHNRANLQDRLPELFDEHAKDGSDMALAMIDIDHFKQLNDSLGHQVGDDLLQFVGQLLRTTGRREDLAIRYGGDEFLLVLPQRSCAQAVDLVRRIVGLFSQRCSSLGVDPQPTMSAGVASLHEHEPATLDELVALADQALYRAKHGGKNAVQVAERSGCEAPTT